MRVWSSRLKWEVASGLGKKARDKAVGTLRGCFASIHRMSIASFLKRLGRWSATVIVAYLIVSPVAGVQLMENALRVERRPVTERAGFAAAIAKVASSGVEDASVVANDGAVLKGWYPRPRPWNGDSVLLLHGVGDNREGSEGYAEMFLRGGYAVLLPDSRAHGESGGALVTYGLLESGDIRRWAEWLAGRNGTDVKEGCVDLFGESLGAAIALQAAGAPGVCAVVAEAPFASFREIGFDRIAQTAHVPVAVARVAGWLILASGFLDARLRYGLDFDKASPERALAASRVPALLIAGLADENIPHRHAEEILRSAGPASELWLVPGAGHTESSSVAPVEFEHRVLGWFRTHRGAARALGA